MLLIQGYICNKKVNQILYAEFGSLKWYFEGSGLALKKTLKQKITSDTNTKYPL